jgi:hypothetical protein
MVGTITSVDSASRQVAINAGDGVAAGIDLSGNTATWKASVWSLSVTDQTVFEGTSGFSALQAGMPVEFDAVTQADGSLSCPRIHVPDSNISNISMFVGPVVRVNAADPVVSIEGIEQIGYYPTVVGIGDGSNAPFNADAANFTISGAVTTLKQLPFDATFDLATVVSGQMVAATMHATEEQPSPIYFPATSITLLPQTINGTIQSISKDGSFTVYKVKLAAYDAFPALAVQTLQATVLDDPATVVVYADSSTQALNAQAIVVGSPFRFNGVVFNDGGTLRMDCLQIEDGVSE